MAQTFEKGEYVSVFEVLQVKAAAMPAYSHTLENKTPLLRPVEISCIATILARDDPKFSR